MIRPTALALALTALAAAPGASAQEFHVDPTAANRVRFVSRASIEEFEGVTSRIDGYVLLDGATLSDSTGGEGTAFYLEVDLGSLDTGIGLRNRHMRDNYLEVSRFPFAVYEGTLEEAVPVGPERFRVAAAGTLTIHGVARERRITCEVSRIGRGYRSVCSFQVLLSDHDIEIPRVMFLKLANEIQLELDFTVAPAGAGDGDAS